MIRRVRVHQGSRRAGRGAILASLLASVAVAGVGAGSAVAKPVTIAGYGTATGQVKRPQGVGVNQATHDLYALDAPSIEGRVQEFGPSGEFLTSWGGFEEPRGLVVAPSGDVWVSDERGQLVEFGSGGELLRTVTGEGGYPLAVDEAGDVWVGEDGRVQELGPTGAHVATVTLNEAGETEALAVSAGGEDVYVIGKSASGVVVSNVREYKTADGEEVGSPIDEGGEPRALALDKAGDLYVGGECKQEKYGPAIDEIRCSSYDFKEYDSAGVQVEQFGAGQVIGDPGVHSLSSSEGGIAVDESARALYTAGTARSIEGEGNEAVQRFPLPVPGPLPEGERASGVLPTTMTVETSLDPENHKTEYRFEYGTESGVYPDHTSFVLAAGSGFAAETVHAALSGLLPQTTYYFRVTAKSNCNEAAPSEVCTVSGSGGQATTLPAVAVEGESALKVSSDAASLEGVLNPLDVAARWWVECAVGEGAFEPCGTGGSLPAGSEGVKEGAEVQGLAPETVYRYRFAGSDEREGHAYTSYGTPLSFTTQAAEPSSVLPDGRAWEMVSPLDKQNAGFIAPPWQGGLIEAAAGGGGIAYLATGSSEASAPGEPAPEYAQILSLHGGGGWATRDIASPHEQEWGVVQGHFAEFLAFSPDLEAAIVEPQGTATETPLGGASERTPYVRDNAQCATEAVPNKCYLPLVDGQDVTSGEKWGGEQTHALGPVKYVAATPDLSHVVLGSEVPLLAGEPSGHYLYEWSAGQLTSIGVLPGEAHTPSKCVDVTEYRRRHVISVDGDHVIWSSQCEGNHLYMYENGRGGGESVQLDVGATGAYPAEYQDASSDGSRVFFTDEEQLVEGSAATASEPDLYVYEANPDSDPDPGTVHDLSVPLHAGESADVVGTIPGVSEDGSYVYFVADGVLAAGAEPGWHNLYVEHHGAGGWEAPVFIAKLAASTSSGPGDVDDWGGGVGLAKLTAGASGNGQWLAFMSERSLTGYDNEDVSSVHPGERMDEEVFLYDAVTKRLVCASCDPTGARPHGIEADSSIRESSLIDRQDLWSQSTWVAGVIPGWDSMELGAGVYQPRYLSDSGRLFFDSTDALVPQDENKKADVYEYEPPAGGESAPPDDSCTTGAQTYSPAAEGCVSLISSGISSEESAFLDASENGNDVFFLTASQLVKHDTDTAYDVYDAHVCGSGWECPVEEAVPPPCTNTESCRGAPEPQPSVFGAPSSATFAGAGNSAPPVTVVGSPKKVVAKRVGCKKGFVKRKVKKKDECVRAKAKKRAKGSAHRKGGK